MLRRAAPPLPDDGFSARVVTALPTTPQPAPTWPRTVFCVGGALLGVGFAFWQGVRLPDLKLGLVQFEGLAASSIQFFGDPLFAAAIVLTLASLLVAFRAELRDKLMS